MNDLATLILRIAVGIILFAHGLHKFQKWEELNRIWRYDYGLPPGSVGLAGVVQIVGGVTITLGVLSPYVAPIQVFVMLVATWVAIWKHREPFRSTPHGKGWDVNFLLIVALLALILLGDGEWSLVQWMM
ncbi:MAG TPA: DoxX family protein [Anaerolineales bacterium]|nr:DoxX family protein [Anaerolineales bacterium]